MTFFQILWYVCFGGLALIAILAIVGISRYMFWFYFRKCKKCGHHMYYRGFRHNNDGSFFYFHCRHCGNWEKITQAEYLREIGSNTNTDDYE